MELVSDGFEIETEIVVNSLRRGLRIAEIPSHEAERLNGHSHLHAVRDGLRVLSVILRPRIRRVVPSSATPSLKKCHGRSKPTSMVAELRHPV
jgi:hypothetical protein